MRSAVHCFESPNCCLHDCICRCDGCLPDSDPQALELRRLHTALEWFANAEHYESGSVEVIGATVARAAILDLDHVNADEVDRAWASYVPRTAVKLTEAGTMQVAHATGLIPKPSIE